MKGFGRDRRLSHQGARLQEIGQRLLSLSSQSEEEFLSLGNKLQEFSSTSSHIFQQTTLSLQKLDETSDDNILTHIQHLLQEADAVLHPMSEKLYRISKMQDNLQKISSSLHILGISIKVESNRTGSHGQGFMVLGEEIDQIWSHITRDAKVLFSQAAGAGAVLASVKKDITGDYTYYRSMVSGVRESILSAMKEVKEMFLLSSRIVEKIADSAQKIKQEIGKIVCSLQFHDIARQQLEHIHQALEEAGGSLKDTADTKNTQVDSSLRQTGQTLLVQISQLKNAAREMDQAGDGIRKSLAEISEKAKKENEAIRAFQEKLGNQESGKIHTLEKKITQLASILHQAKNLGEHISQTLKPTTRSATQIEQYMKEIEKVGYTINLLSLNALIKAAQNLESGRTFEVLAEEIKQQASYSTELSAKTYDELHILSENNNDLAQILGLLSEQEKKAVAMVSLIKEKSAELGSLNQEITRIVQLLMKNNGRLVTQIMCTAHKIQFEGIFRAGATEILQELETVQTELQGLSPHEPTGEQRGADMESPAGRYTMEKERQIHQQAILGERIKKDNSEEASSQGGKADPKKVEEEIFKEDKSQQEDSLGDNVELF